MLRNKLFNYAILSYLNILARLFAHNITIWVCVTLASFEYVLSKVHNRLIT